MSNDKDNGEMLTDRSAGRTSPLPKLNSKAYDNLDSKDKSNRFKSVVADDKAADIESYNHRITESGYGRLT